MRHEADVVVVGGGGAALAAASSARSAGAEVILLEKNPQLGGSTAWSVGSVTATQTPHQKKAGITDNPQDHLEDLRLFSRALKLEHRDLDDVIAKLALNPSQDQLQLQRLKRRKLLLKDQILQLEKQLTPDIRA